jgi:hypothetical protein
VDSHTSPAAIPAPVRKRRTKKAKSAASPTSPAGGAARVHVAHGPELLSPAPRAALPMPPVNSSPRQRSSSSQQRSRQGVPAGIVEPTLPTPPWPTLLNQEPRDSDETLDGIAYVRHSAPASTNSLFVAIAYAMEHEARLARLRVERGILVVPSFLPDNCRESVLSWMRSNVSIRHPLLLGLSPYMFRARLYDNTNFVLYSRHGQVQPRTWQEYMHLMLSLSTEPDELMLLCAALCFKTQIIVTVQHLGSKVFSPTNAQRRIHLLFSPQWRHVSWAHHPDAACVDSDNCSSSSRMHLHQALETPPLEPVSEIVPARARLGHLSDWQNTHRQFIIEAHNGFTGHPGISATVRILQQAGHRWRGMTAQVAQFISQCPTCNLARIQLNPARTAHSSLRLMAAPLRRWHCDNTGILETCVHTGFTRIQAAICETTGFVVLSGSRYGACLELVLSLVQIVGTFGLFESFHSDNGPENDAYVMHEFERLTGIKHTLAVPMNPQTNGIVESTIKNVKRFLRCMISDGLCRFNSWGLMLPILQQAINSTACGPLNVSPNSIVFASLFTPTSFVIPTTYFDAPEEEAINLADGNFYPPSANFVTRATYFQQAVTNQRHDLLLQALHAAMASPSLEPEDIIAGSQVLIPWPGERAPSSLHPNRRGPYIVSAVSGNVLSLVHAVHPLPDSQPFALRWSLQAQLYSLDPILETDPLDPSAVNAPAGLPLQRTIDCVLEHTLMPSFDRSNDPDLLRFHVENQVFTCRLFGVRQDFDSLYHLRRDYYYEEIRHTLAFDSYIANHPFLTGHIPIASMPPTWDPRAVSQPNRPMHDPVLEAERAIPIVDPDDPIENAQ